MNNQFKRINIDNIKTEEKDKTKNSKKMGSTGRCPYNNVCGGCDYIDVPYIEQLNEKQKQIQKMFGDFCEVKNIISADNRLFYRNKVNAAFGRAKKGEIISGIYEAGTHNIINVEKCLLENEKADEIVQSIKKLAKSFKIKIYDEDTGFGLLRHVMVRTAHKTGQILVVLVLSSPVMPSKNNFVKALVKLHPEITSVVLNVNDKKTSMVLGDRDIVIYGKGYIEDVLCGNRYRISPQSFYQINSEQTEKLYKKAIRLADLKGNEKVIDAYCGIGTIGISASKTAGKVIGVELNKDAVRDARINAKLNNIKNIDFVCDDAGKFMVKMAEKGEKADVVFMDPPRAGSDEAFINAIKVLSPQKVVYISCNPETLLRDIKLFKKNGYRPEVLYPVDMFVNTEHVETVCLLSNRKALGKPR